MASSSCSIFIMFLYNEKTSAKSNPERHEIIKMKIYLSAKALEKGVKNGNIRQDGIVHHICVNIHRA